jgi:hypothetical protein
LHILLVEDDAQDAELVDHALHRAGFDFRITCVQTREQFAQQLHTQPPDLILSDHGLPAFDGFSALALARQECPDVPFVFVTGALVGGHPVPGTTACVLKHELSNLAPVVRGVLQEAPRHGPATAAASRGQRLKQAWRSAAGKLKDLVLGE